MSENYPISNDANFVPHVNIEALNLREVADSILNEIVSNIAETQLYITDVYAHTLICRTLGPRNYDVFRLYIFHGGWIVTKSQCENSEHSLDKSFLPKNFEELKKLLNAALDCTLEKREH